MIAPITDSAESTVHSGRKSRGPLGPLPKLSQTARRALATLGFLAAGNAVLLIAQAFLLVSMVTAIVGSIVGNEIDFTTEAPFLLLVFGLRAALTWLIRVVSAQAATRTKEELRAKAVDHAVKLGPEWIATHGAGQLTALTTKGLDALDAYFAEYLPALVTAAVVPLGVGTAILVAGWPSAVIIALTLPLLPIFAILIGKQTEEKVSASTDAVHRLSGHLSELIRILPVLTAFRRAKAQAETVRRASDQHRRTTVSTLRLAFASSFALELAATLSVALIAVIIGVRLASGDLTLVIGLGVLVLAPECFQPIRAVGAAFHASEDGAEAVRRVAEVLAEPLPMEGKLSPGRGEIRIENLAVARRGGFAPDGESLTVRPGELTQLRSPSGTGKSTLLAVLLGFVQPSSGSVFIDNTPLQDIDMSIWRRQLAWVPQNPIFAGSSVREELELAVADSSRALTVAEIDAVLTRLDIAELVDREPDQLSVGQRQRVAVARAVLRIQHGAWLLLLDEPTSHLDKITAGRVMALVDELRKDGAAVLLAAHPRSAANTPTQPALGFSLLPEYLTEVPQPESKNSVARADILPLNHLVDRRLITSGILGGIALLMGVLLTATSGWLIAKASQQPPILTLSVAVVGVRTFGLGRAVLRYLERLRTHDAAFRLATQVRERLWNAVVRLGPVRMHSLRQGEGQRLLAQDVDAIRDLLPRVVTPPIIAGFVLIAAVAIQWWVLPAAGILLAATVVITVVLVPILAVRAENQSTYLLGEGRREVSAKVFELFYSAAELVAFGAYRQRRTDLVEADVQLATLARKQAFGVGVADAAITLLLGIAAVGSLLLAVPSVNSGEFTVVLAPLLALIPLALGEVLGLLPPIARHGKTLRQARTRLGKILVLADKVPSVSLPSTKDSEQRDIKFRAADFSWPGSVEPILREVTLDIPVGSWVAVTGPSGAGKSTLLTALLGFLPPSNGAIQKADRVAWVPQEPQLVASSVAENLRLADPHPDPTTDQDRLTEALRQVGLPTLDLATVLGSGGTGLSGGQAQRVAVARALLAAKDTELVLLDEPTSQLDSAAARALWQTLRTELAGHTVVYVTHRAEEVEHADVVLEIANARVQARIQTQAQVEKTAPELLDIGGRA